MAKTSLKQHILTVLKDAKGSSLTAKQIETKLRDKGINYPHKAVTSRVSETFSERDDLGRYLVDRSDYNAGEKTYSATPALLSAV